MKKNTKNLVCTLLTIVFIHCQLSPANRGKQPARLQAPTLTIRAILNAAQHNISLESLLAFYSYPFFRNPADNRSLLDTACFEGNEEIVTNLINSMQILKPTEFVRRYINSPGLFGKRPLHYAAQSGNPFIIQQLLKIGADPNVVNDDGWNALHYAQSTSAIEILINAGVNPSALTYQNETIFHFAAQNPATAFAFLATILEALGKKYPDKSFASLLNKKDRYSAKTVLYLIAEACTINIVECIALLLASGANSLIPNKEYRLPIHEIIYRHTTCETAEQREQLRQATLLLWAYYRTT